MDTENTAPENTHLEFPVRMRKGLLTRIWFAARWRGISPQEFVRHAVVSELQRSGDYWRLHQIEDKRVHDGSFTVSSGD